MRIGLIGLGNWGTALGQHLACKGHEVLGWSNDPQQVSGIAAQHRNPRCLSEVLLDDRFSATESLQGAMAGEMVLIVLPSAALEAVVPQMKPPAGSVLISAIKGLESHTLLTPLQFLRGRLTGSFELCVISGPSFARDVIARKPCGVVAGAEREEIARLVAETFSNEFMRVYVSTDPLGVELGGIVKNVIAIAAGISDGIGLGDSARAALITRGLAEMVRFAEVMGAERQTLFGLSGMGDLAMTASSDLSRNRQVGLRLGRGETLPQIIQALGSVAEGVYTTPVLLELAAKHGIEMPITDQVARLLRGETTPAEMARALITRPLKKEF